jgi:hypothetical protein
MVAVECRMQEFAPNHPSFMCSSDGDDTPEVVVQRGRVMAYTFDSLGYAKKLRDGGVPRDQAEAHAEAARDFIMAELATKADVLAVSADLLATEQKLQTSIEKLDTKIDTQALRLTVRLGTIVVVGLGALGAALKLI